MDLHHWDTHQCHVAAHVAQEDIFLREHFWIQLLRQGTAQVEKGQSWRDSAANSGESTTAMPAMSDQPASLATPRAAAAAVSLCTDGNTLSVNGRNELLSRNTHMTHSRTAAEGMHWQRVVADLANPADMDCEQTLE